MEFVQREAQRTGWAPVRVPQMRTQGSRHLNQELKAMLNVDEVHPSREQRGSKKQSVSLVEPSLWDVVWEVPGQGRDGQSNLPDHGYGSILPGLVRVVHQPRSSGTRNSGSSSNGTPSGDTGGEDPSGEAGDPPDPDCLVDDEPETVGPETDGSSLPEPV